MLFLGTGSGRASLTRGCSSLLFREKNNSVLIDCGEGISKALLQHNIAYSGIGSIVISHFHADHLAGLPGLITQMKLAGRNIPLNIFIPLNLKKTLENVFNSFLLFKESVSFPINIIEYASGETIKLNKDLSMKGVKNSHLSNKHNIEYISSDTFISSSFLFSLSEKNIFYTSDIGSAEDLFLFDEKVDYIISETTHIPPEKLLQALVKYEPETIFLTHIDDNTKIECWYNSIDKKIKKYFVISADGMELSI